MSESPKSEHVDKNDEKHESEKHHEAHKQADHNKKDESKESHKSHKSTEHQKDKTEHHETHTHTSKIAEPAKSSINTLLYVLIFFSIALIAYNQVTINQMVEASSASNSLSSQQTSQAPQLTGNAEADAISIVLAKGVPPIYGPELGISFDDPVAGMNVLKELDPSYGKKKIVLEGEDLQRYIKIGTTPTMTCEFCCSAKTMVTPSGGAACGCAHSWAMRGLVAYLVKNHGTEYTDEQIMQQLSKWKSHFFPKQMVKRFLDQSSTGQYTPDIAALLLDIDTSKLQNVKSADITSSLQNAPNMVGGC